MSHRILLIDPFKNLLNAYRIILEEEKYLVETALNLKDAYQNLIRRQYSVIITEYIPPFEATDYVIQWVKKKAPETYIIIVTNASVDDKTYEKLFNIGVDDFILKPYSPRRVLVHVKKGLKQRDLIVNSKALERLSLLEPITQEVQDLIYNTIFFKKCLRQEIKKAKRHHHSFSLLLIQIPTREKIGDQFDNFYMELMKIVKKYTREEDLVGKDNGEIGIILPETDQIGSKALMDRLSDLINNHPAFKVDNILRMVAQNLFIRSFTYPNNFALPESLSPVLEDVNRGYFHN